MTVNAAREAYEQAGVSPLDLNSVELHDCFATAEVLHYENLQLAPKGEAGRWVDEKLTDLAGAHRVTRAGPRSTRAVACSPRAPDRRDGRRHICEITWQLRGQAGGPPGTRPQGGHGAHDRPWQRLRSAHLDEVARLRSATI